MRGSGVWGVARGVAAVLVSALACSAGADVLSKAHELGVSELTLQEISPLSARNGTTTTIVVDLGGRDVVLEVSPDSVRSESFTVVLDHGGGVQEEITPPPTNVVRGEIIGEPGSIVAGTIVDGATRLMIMLADETWTIQPAPEEGDAVHAVFPERSLLDHGGSCDVPMRPRDAGFAPAPDRQPMHHMAGGTAGRFGNRGTGDFRIAEIAIEADWRLFNNFFNQNETNLLNDIDTVLAGVAAAYERDVSLTYELTHVLIRTSSGADPYTTNNASDLLSQFRDEWNVNQTGIQRDVAHLWTGRNLQGSTIGIAFLGVICGSSSYGANQIRFSGNLNSRVGLFAHELGHNWSAEHCNGQSECRIMCSGLGGCNGLGNPPRFAAGPIGQISSHIASRTCIDNLGIDLPVAEDFNGAVLDPATWANAVGFSFVNDGSAPSGGRAGRFEPPFTVAATAPIDLNVAPGNGVAVRIAVRPEESTETPFKILAALVGEAGQVAGDIFIEGTPGYQSQAVYIPASMLGNEVSVRLNTASTGPFWRFDDLDIFEIAESSAQASLPLSDDYERAGLFLDLWQPSDVDVIRDLDSAPSGSHYATMPANGRMETVDLSAAGASDIVFGALVSSPEGASGSNEIVMSYLNSSSQWLEAARFDASSFTADGFLIAEVVLPADAAHNGLRVAIETVGAGGSTPWRFDDFEVGGERRGSDCVADVAPPQGVLDLTDISTFVAGFTNGDPIADLAEPFGIYDLSDVSAFVASFVAGCP